MVRRFASMGLLLSSLFSFACNDSVDEYDSIGSCLSCAPKPVDLEPAIWTGADGATWKGSGLRIGVYDFGPDKPAHHAEVYLSSRRLVGAREQTIRLQLYAMPDAYVAGEVVLPVRRLELFTTPFAFVAVDDEDLVSGSVRVLVRDGRFSGSLTLPEGEILTFEGPADLQCATTEIPNQTKPGNAVSDFELGSTFCSPLKALGFPRPAE